MKQPNFKTKILKWLLEIFPFNKPLRKDRSKVTSEQFNFLEKHTRNVFKDIFQFLVKRKK